MLIIDEVQSGMGRTGKMFALDHHEGVKADIVCLAKGLGSGMPIGACVARADVMDWHKGAHASTFGGNPVALTAALKTIELLQGGLVENSRVVGDYLRAGLDKLKEKYDCIGDVRGFGMMLGVEFVTDKQSLSPAVELRDKIEYACYERGLIILGCGNNTIRWSPPLILSKENVDVALQIFAVYRGVCSNRVQDGSRMPTTATTRGAESGAGNRRRSSKAATRISIASIRSWTRSRGP